MSGGKAGLRDVAINSESQQKRKYKRQWEGKKENGERKKEFDSEYT